MENSQVLNWIEQLNESGNYKEEGFVLHQVSMTMWEHKEEEIRKLLLHPPFDWKRIEYMRMAYQEGIPLERLEEMKEADLPSMQLKKDDYLRQKYYAEKAAVEGRENPNTAYLIQTVEIMNQQVNLQLEESRKVTEYLIQNLNKKEEEINQLRGKECIDDDKPNKREASACAMLQRKPIIPTSQRKKYRKALEKKKKKVAWKHRLTQRKRENQEEALLNLICSPEFDEAQTAVMIDGYERGLEVKEIKRYAVPGFSMEKMKMIEERLLKKHPKQTEEKRTTEMKPKLPVQGEEGNMEIKEDEITIYL